MPKKTKSAKKPRGKVSVQVRVKTKAGAKKAKVKAKAKAPRFSRKAEQEKRFKISQKFAARLIEKFKRTVKSVVVFGSTARGVATPKSDIDVFVILDDTKIEKEIPSEIKDRIWNEILAIAKDVDERIAVQAFMFLTEFWESLRVAEPVTLAVLRDGVPIFDVGVFMPAKRMLQRGNIPTTREAVDKKIFAAPQFVEYAQSRVKSAAHYMEQAMATAGNAVLMFIGRVPQNKEAVPGELEEYFVKQEILEKKYVDDAREIIKFAKDVEHKKEFPDIGAKTDKMLKLTADFVKRMQLLIKELEMRKKTTILMRTYKTFLKANVGALRYVGVKPPEELKDLPKVVYEQFPELKDLHAELFAGLTKALSMIKEGKGEHVPERQVYAMRERTKEFVIRLGQKLKELKEAGKIKPPEEEARIHEEREEKKIKEELAKELPEAAKERPEAALGPEDHVVEKLGGESEEGEGEIEKARVSEDRTARVSKDTSEDKSEEKSETKSEEKIEEKIEKKKSEPEKE